MLYLFDRSVYMLYTYKFVDETQKAAYFLATPQSLSRCVGEAAILECAVGGWPAQDVEWLRQGKITYHLC